MTDKIDDGGPAFPRTVQRWNDSLDHSVQGMSLRDWFAGLSVQAMLASPELMSVVTSGSILDGTAAERMARRAYQVADAMLAARKASS